MNSSSSGDVLVLAIENDRWCSSSPGMQMSTYWPGLNVNGSSSSTVRRSSRMSPVSASTASTRVATVRGGVPPCRISSS